MASERAGIKREGSTPEPGNRSLASALGRSIDWLEDSRVPLSAHLATFLFAVVLRCFLESFSDREPLRLELLQHYVLSYVSLALALLILCHHVLREPLERLARAILPCFILLSIVPTLDLILSGGQGIDIRYLQRAPTMDLLTSFVTFLGGGAADGITPGMRVEISLALLLLGLYACAKTRDPVRSTLLVLAAYGLIFLYLGMPILTERLVSLIGLDYHYSPTFMSAFYLLLLVPLAAWAYRLFDRGYAAALVRDLRPLRLMHYELMFLLGILLAERHFAITQESLFPTMLVVVAIALAWTSSVVTNNLADVETDRIANPGRPNVTGAIPPAHYRTLSWVFLVAAVAYAGAAAFEAGFVILLFVGVYFLYSSPPLRLKRVPVLSKVCIGLNSMALFALGGFFATRELTVTMPVALLFIAGFSLAANLIDLKDVEGDRAAGITTLPLVVGFRASQFLIGTVALVLHPLIALALGDRRLLIPSTVLGAILFTLICRRRYAERPVILLYVVSLLALASYGLASR